MASPTAKFAFEELSLHDRIELLDGLLALLSADEVRVAVKEPECLGIVAEARANRARAVSRTCAIRSGCPGPAVRRACERGTISPLTASL